MALLNGPASGPYTEAEARSLITQLAQHFNIPAPAFRVVRRRRGAYIVRHRTIIASLDNWAGINVIVHEFAHHLDHYRRTAEGIAGGLSARPVIQFNGFSLSRGRRDYHGPRFCQALLDTAAAAFPDPRDYTWTKEYRGVTAWARTRGLVRYAPVVPTPPVDVQVIFPPRREETSLVGLPPVKKERKPITHNETPEDAARVLELRRQGMGYVRIAMAMGWTKDTGGWRPWRVVNAQKQLDNAAAVA